MTLKMYCDEITVVVFFHIDYQAPPRGVSGPLLRKVHGESLTGNQNQKGLASSKLCLCNIVLCVFSACFCIYSDWHHTNILMLYVWLSYCKVLAIIWASCVHFETKCEWTWIIHVSKNKRFMQLLFCTKAKPCTQWKAAVAMQGPFSQILTIKKERKKERKKWHTYIQYCTNSAQLNVCFKNVNLNYDLFIELS